MIQNLDKRKINLVNNQQGHGMKTNKFKDGIAGKIRNKKNF